MNVALSGCMGRMGQEIVRLLCNTDGVNLVLAVVRPGSRFTGQDIGVLLEGRARGIVLTDELALTNTRVDVLIDFSSAEAACGHVAMAVERRVPVVIGATGMSEEQRRAVVRASEHSAIMLAPNTSLGATVLTALSKIAMQVFEDWDVSIVDVHHRGKRDAPSGTALALKAEILGAAYALNAPIDIASVRVGATVGTHHVTFAGTGETVELTHRADDRQAYAGGALRAARWIINRPPGLYSMGDTLNI